MSDYLFIPPNSGLSKGLIFFTLNILLVRKLFGLFCRIWFLLCCFWINCHTEAKRSKAESDDPSPVHRAGGLAHSTCTAQHSLPSPGGGVGFLAVSRSSPRASRETPTNSSVDQKRPLPRRNLSRGRRRNSRIRLVGSTDPRPRVPKFPGKPSPEHGAAVVAAPHAAAVAAPPRSPLRTRLPRHLRWRLRQEPRYAVRFAPIPSSLSVYSLYAPRPNKRSTKCVSAAAVPCLSL
jgi:hypothetical protein